MNKQLSFNSLQIKSNLFVFKINITTKTNLMNNISTKKEELGHWVASMH